ncbi:uncharacterized protein [Parasteatoda tepidariorum]|uniref:uncharacterized protein isoform X2 n=1 Tax=Parasteatoda tepidariorum TaxID=114398 RepID=UPI0039BCA924
MMAWIGFIFLTIFMMLAATSHAVLQYGQITNKMICDTNDNKLIEDVAVCRNEHKTEKNLEISKKCYSKIDPETNGDTAAFMKTACKDLTLYDKVDDCFEIYKQDQHESCLTQAFYENGHYEMLGMNFLDDMAFGYDGFGGGFYGF